jgi:glycosyltransferase involved in cell wall biosynthesis
MYRVVYSGMDMAAFAGAGPEPKLRAELGIPPAAPVVGKVARLFELKGHDLLLLAAEMILKQQPETRFLLVGDGNLRTELTAEIKARGMEKNFVFTGLVAPDAVPAYVAQMDVLVHLSLREGLPRAAVQALAAGKPVVGLNLDGTPEVVLDGQTGYVCEPGDTAAVAAAVIRLLEQPELRRKLGEAGQALVLREFDWRLMAERIEEQYYEVLEVKN